MKESYEDDHFKTVSVIVAHPDDQTLWTGGTILLHPLGDCFVISLYRRSDLDQAPKFSKALIQLDGQGDIGGLDDVIDQSPLSESEVEDFILKLLHEISSYHYS